MPMLTDQPRNGTSVRAVRHNGAMRGREVGLPSYRTPREVRYERAIARELMLGNIGGWLFVILGAVMIGFAILGFAAGPLISGVACLGVAALCFGGAWYVVRVTHFFAGIMTDRIGWPRPPRPPVPVLSRVHALLASLRRQEAEGR